MSVSDSKIILERSVGIKHALLLEEECFSVTVELDWKLRKMIFLCLLTLPVSFCAAHGNNANLPSSINKI